MGFEVNLKNVSQAVQEAVAGFMAGDGDDDTKIDSKEEYQNLSNYLAGEGNMLNRDEVSFVKEKLDDYEKALEKEKKEEFEKKVPQQTKDDVDEILRRHGDPDKVDSDVEAQELALLLRNKKGTLNRYSEEFIKNLLIDSGYGEYLNSNDNRDGEEVPPEKPSEPDEPQKKKGLTEENIRNPKKTIKPPFADRLPAQKPEPRVPLTDKQKQDIIEKLTGKRI